MRATLKNMTDVMNVLVREKMTPDEEDFLRIASRIIEENRDYLKYIGSEKRMPQYSRKTMQECF